MNKDKAAKEIHKLVDQLVTEDGDESQLRVQLYRLQGSFEVLEECREILEVEDGASLTEKLRKLKRELVVFKTTSPKCVVKPSVVPFAIGMWKGECGSYYEEQPENNFCPNCGGKIEVQP